MTAHAAPGGLDTSFDRDGRFVMDIFGAADVVRAIVIQPDGKLVAGGSVENASGNRDFGLIRLNQNGSPDTSFNFDGLTMTAFGSDDDVLQALLIQPDGKLVAAGYTVNDNGDTDFALARYKTDGTLDDGFGDGGRVVTTFGADAGEQARALVLYPNGKIAVAGFSSAAGDNDFALARYNPDGQLDSTFGNGDGRVLDDFKHPISSTPSFDDARALVLQPDGKLVAAGYRQHFDNQDITLARYLPNGERDGSFGDGIPRGHIIQFSADSLDQAHALGLQSDGKLVAAGLSDMSGSFDFILLRYDANGLLDPSFGGGDGIVLTDFSGLGSTDIGSALMILPNGKIVMSGASDADDFRYDFAIARYNDNGSLDKRFGTKGLFITDLGSDFGLDRGIALALQPNGRLVMGGFAGRESESDFALVRYLSEPIRCGGRVVTQLGTAGNDLIMGTPGDDVIHGQGGNDEINGLGGNDIICGASGDDTLSGGDGRDRLVGGPGKDICSGGPGSNDSATGCEIVSAVP